MTVIHWKEWTIDFSPKGITVDPADEKIAQVVNAAYQEVRVPGYSRNPNNDLADGIAALLPGATVTDYEREIDAEGLMFGNRAGFTLKGGPGSGNFSHAGRPGKRGGSAPASNIQNMGANRNAKEYSYDYWGDTQVTRAKQVSPELLKNLKSFRWDEKNNVPIEDHEGSWESALALQTVFDKIKENTGMDLLKQYPFYQVKVAKSNRAFNSAFRRAVSDAGGKAVGLDVSDVLSACTPDGILLRPVTIGADGQPFIKMEGMKGATVPAYPIYLHEVGHAFGYKALERYETGKTRNIILTWESAYFSDRGFDRETEYAKQSHKEGFAESFVKYIMKGGRNAPNKITSSNPYKPTTDEFWDSLIDLVKKEGFA